MIKQLLPNRVSKTLLTIAAFIMVAISASAQEPTWTAEAYDCLNEGWTGSVFSGGFNFDNITVEYYEETNTLVAKNYMGGEGTDLTIVLNADGSIKTINGETRDSYGSMGAYTGNDDYYFAYFYPDYDTYVVANKDYGYIILSGYFYKDYNDAGTWLYYMIEWPKPVPAPKVIELSSYNINTTGGTFNFDTNVEFAGGATTVNAISTKSGNKYPATLSLDPDDYTIVNLSFEKSLKVGNTYTIEIPDNCIKSIYNEALVDTVLTFTVTEKGTEVVEEPAWTTHATVWAGEGYFYNPDNNDVIVSYYEKSHTLKIENFMGDYSDDLTVVVNTEGGVDDYGDYSITSINGSGQYGGGYAGWSYSAGSYIEPYWVDFYAPYCYALPEYEYGEFGGCGYGYNNDNSSVWANYYISWYNGDINKSVLEDAIAEANNVIAYANDKGLNVPTSLTSAVEAGQTALDTQDSSSYEDKAVAINEEMSSDYLQALSTVSSLYDMYKYVPVGINVFELTPANASKIEEEFASINYSLYFASGIELYLAMNDFKEALLKYSVTMPKANETFTIQDKASGLYLNIANGEAYVAETPTHFQFHRVAEEKAGLGSWYLYNTEERAYMGYDDDLSNVVEEWSSKSQFCISTVSKNIWYISPIANPEKYVMAGRYNNVTFGEQERAHAEWYIAYSEVPTYDITEAEENTSDAEATVITSAQAANIEGTFYTINGAKLSAAQKGINIVKYNNGTVKKVLVK